MELNLQSLAPVCFLTREPFAAGDRIVSTLVRGSEFEVLRYDVLASRAEGFAPEGQVACRWVHVFKPKTADDNPERTLKLSAENLFLTLADPATEFTPENDRLVRFLALMLERKKVLKLRGRNADGTKDLYEHGRTKQVFEVTAGEMNQEFFTAVQGQLSILVGEPRRAASLPAEASPAAAGTAG
jgi:hypothetical protein